MRKTQLSRRALLAVAVSGAVGGAMIAPVTASAGLAVATPPNTLNLVATAQKGIGFFPKHSHQGTQGSWGGNVTGDDTGVDRSMGTRIGKGWLCNIQLQLSRGNLSLQGMLPEGRAHHVQIAVIGGTGAYNGARGTAVLTNVSATKARIAVTFKP